MFSSNELIQFVFADENDTYYCEDLTQPDLYQYLWRRLHAGARCSAVYFLRADERGTRFTIRTFGDRNAQRYEPRAGFNINLFGNVRNEQGEWIQKQLRNRRDDAVAFVCDLEEFCRVAESGDWWNILRCIAEDKRRTGFFVLTVSPENERCAELLLKSPVFDWMEDNAVLDARHGELRELFDMIRQRKGSEACIFLNHSSEWSLRGLVWQAACMDKSRFISEAELDKAVRYLSVYLNSLHVQYKQPLFVHTMPAAYLRYQDIYTRLIEDTVWTRLLENSCKAEYTADSEGETIQVYRSRESITGKCIPRLYAERRRLSADPETEACLNNAIMALMTPDNRPENLTAVNAIDSMSKLMGASTSPDMVCARRVLRAISWCCHQIGTSYGSPEEQRVSDLEKYTKGYTEMYAEWRRVEKALSQSTEALPKSEYELLCAQETELKEACTQYGQILDALSSDAHGLALGMKIKKSLQNLIELKERIHDSSEPDRETVHIKLPEEKKIEIEDEDEDSGWTEWTTPPSQRQ